MKPHPSIKNLFADVPGSSTGEDFLTLLQTDHVRVERIVSRGQGSPENFWYDQPDSEWVVLLQGTAILQFADESRVSLEAGDYLMIPSHVKHRVEKTSADAVWLAVHSS